MENCLKKNVKTSVAGLAMMTSMLVPLAASADQVTLRSTDGTINVSGDFVEFKDDTYIVRTALGDLRIAAAQVLCEGDACPVFEEVTADVAIVGSDAIGLGMMPLLMGGYASSLDADAEITNTGEGESIATLVGDDGYGDDIGSYLVSAKSDDAAFEALLAGEANIGMASRRITKEEAQALRADGAGSMVSPAQEHILAVDSMIVATHASNEVGQLSIDQLRGIFSGQITNWSEVGGPDSAINVVMRNEDSASHDFFMSYLFGDDRPTFLPQAISPTDQTVSNVLYSDKHAIGYLGFAFQRGAKPISLVNECGIATAPDAFSAKTEEYALNRRMYLYNRADNLDAATASFLDFATSTEADAVIAKSGFIDLGITRRAQSMTEGRGAAMSAEVARYDVGFEGEFMNAMLEEMATQDRLSTTLRFRTGSSKIDERGKLDVQRLITYLEDAPAGTNITFVGFTDDVGAFEANRNLAQGRAESVAQIVADLAEDRLDHINFATTGFGEIAPSACNISDRGREINRRVEVWISETANG